MCIVSGCGHHVIVSCDWSIITEWRHWTAAHLHTSAGGQGRRSCRVRANLMQTLGSQPTWNSFPSVAMKTSKRDANLLPNGLMSRRVIFKPCYVTKNAIAFSNLLQSLCANAIHCDKLNIQQITQHTSWRSFFKSAKSEPLNSPNPSPLRTSVVLER